MRTELNVQICQYAIEAIREGDLNIARDLGFTTEELRAMEALTLRDLRHLARMSSHFLKLSVDHTCLRSALQHIQRESEQDLMQDELIRLGASYPMMRSLFGMTTLQFAARRHLLGANGRGAGRPRDPTTEEEAAVWHVWEESAEHSLPERITQATKASNLTACQVWMLMERWERDGLITDDSQGGATDAA